MGMQGLDSGISWTRDAHRLGACREVCFTDSQIVKTLGWGLGSFLMVIFVLDYSSDK